MSNTVRQASFNGGEIAPISFGKTDSPAYQHGLRTALNFIPSMEGPIFNRPGTRYVTPVNDASYAPRLEAFSFADDQNFIIEIGEGYLRFIQAGALLGGVAVTGVPPWARADLMRLKFSQVGDVITVTHPSYQPYEIARISNLNWTVTALSFTPQAFFGVSKPRIANVPVLATNGWGGFAGISRLSPVNDLWNAFTPYAVGDFVLHLEVNDFGGHGAGYHLYQSTKDANIGSVPNYNSNADWYDWTYQTSGAAPYSFGNYAWNVGDQKMYVATGEIPVNTGGTNTPPGALWAVASDETRPGKVWQFVVTTLWQDEKGGTHETAASSPSQALSLAIYTDRPVTILWGNDSAAPPAPTYWVILGYNVYRGRNGIWGLVASVPTKGTANYSTFADDGSPPDYGTQPPRGTNPFDVATGAGAKTQSWPGANTYHEQRQLYARSNLKPQDWWASKTGQPKNFDVNTPVVDTDSYNFKPASERLEDIRSLLSLRHLLIFTGAGVWNGYGAGNGAISPSSIILRRCVQQGASFLDPIPLDRAAVFQTARGRIMDLQWDWRSDSYVGRDISVIARHLFDGHNIVDWANAEVPYNLVWAVRNDGVLLSLTYGSGGVEAWARHTTTGVFERVATIIETDPATGVSEDAVYVVVRRQVNGVAVRYIERFSSRILPQKQVINADLTSTFTEDVRLSNFLDASLQYDGRSSAGPTLTLTGASFLGGAQVTATASANFIGSPVRGFAAGDIGASIVLDPDGLGSGPIEATIVGVTDPLNATVLLDAAVPAAYQALPVAAIAFAPAVLTGLGHLEGMSVNALLDGAVAGPFTVTGGTITLGTPAVIAQVGLGYNSDLELLDLAAEAVKANVKNVAKVFFEVVSSRGLLVGERLTTRLIAPQIQTVEGGNTVPGLTTGIVEVAIASSWNRGGRAALRQSDPLPLTVNAVIRELVVGGRS